MCRCSRGFGGHSKYVGVVMDGRSGCLVVVMDVVDVACWRSRGRGGRSKYVGVVVADVVSMWA